MDKNMINIDDLFRQRLGGGEEEERSGAWLQMRGLLDEKMPVGVVNWRRMLMFTGGLALLAAVSITGYEVSSSTRNLADASINTANNSTDKQSAITINSNKVLSGNNQPATKTTTSANNNSSSNNNNNNTNNVTAVAPVANNTTSNGNTNTPTANNSSTNEQKNNTVAVNNNATQPVANTTVTTNNNNSTVASVNADNNDNNKTQKHTTTPKHSASNGIIPAGSHVVNNNNIAHKQHPVTATPPVANTTVNKKNHNKIVNKDNIMPASGNNVTSNTATVATSTNGTSGQKKSNTTVYDLKDSIDRLVVKQHYIVDPVSRVATYRTDTVAISKMPHFIIAASTDKEVVVADNKKHQKNNVSGQAKKQKTNSSSDVLLAAKLNESKTSTVADNAANTATAKVVTKHNKAGWDWSVLGQALRDFEYNLGKVKVYPGLIGGINKTFGNYSNSGFQFGMTTEFVVNDQMSVMAEFKYMQRFNGGVINNDYSVNNGQYVAPVWLVTTNSYHHYFNYSTMNSLEMPIAIRYRTGDFYIYAGGNFVYNFAINATEGLSSLSSSEVNTYNSTSGWKETTPKMNIADFGSRFGIGYLFGASYEFTPSIMIDARLTRTFWDNANTDQAKQVSNFLLKGPSTQLSIIYRLNHQRPETVSPRY